MLIIKRAGNSSRKSGWAYDFDLLRKIQVDLTIQYNERLQLEQINDFLAYLETNFAIRSVAADDDKKEIADETV